jgi:hypothetical protein
MNDSLGNMGKLESSISKQIGHLSSAGNINLPNYVADQKHDSHKMNIVSFCFGFAFSFVYICPVVEARPSKLLLVITYFKSPNQQYSYIILLLKVFYLYLKN